LIRDILYFKPQYRGTEPEQALVFLMHLLKRRAIIFFISDFLGPGFEPERLRVPLGVAARRHDVVAISLSDQVETDLPRAGLVDLEDLETGEIMTINTADRDLRGRYADFRRAESEKRERMLKSLGIDRIYLKTDDDCTPKLHKFFQERARRFR
jgi:uncharacterized protein (DUF58 family)